MGTGRGDAAICVLTPDEGCLSQTAGTCRVSEWHLRRSNRNECDKS